MQFEIILAEKKVKPHQVTALHLLVGFALLAATAITLLAKTLPQNTGDTIQTFSEDNIEVLLSIISGFSLIIITLALFRNKWLRRTQVNKLFRILELIACIVVAAFLYLQQYQILSALFVLLVFTVAFSLFWETGKSNLALTVTIHDAGVTLPVNSRRRSLKWTEIENILLRHGALTINCTNNRMYQWMAANNDIDIASFEAYCNAQIQAALKKRRDTDW